MPIINQVVKGSGGSAPAHYLTFGIDNNGRLVPGLGATNVIDLTGCTTINGMYLLNEAYKNNTLITGAVNMSDVQIIGSSRNACASMFEGCTGITSIDLSSLTTISSLSGADRMFANCTGITSVVLSSLTTISGNMGMNNCFYGCTGITNVDLSSLTTISGNSAMNACFDGNGITSIDLPSLTTISSTNAMQYCFGNCTNLSRVSFYALDTNSFGTQTNQFNYMLSGVTGCTVHFPMRVQSTIGSWASVTGGFSGTNTTVLFDIVTTLTGTDTNAYTRSQKNSTSTATAWDNGGTLYYTSGTTEPTVGGTIYSDAACTTAVTTIDTIA